MLRRPLSRGKERKGVCTHSLLQASVAMSGLRVPSQLLQGLGETGIERV